MSALFLRSLSPSLGFRFIPSRLCHSSLPASWPPPNFLSTLFLPSAPGRDVPEAPPSPSPKLRFLQQRRNAQRCLRTLGHERVAGWPLCGRQIENDLGNEYPITACSFFAKKDIFTFLNNIRQVTSFLVSLFFFAHALPFYVSGSLCSKG